MSAVPIGKMCESELDAIFTFKLASRLMAPFVVKEFNSLRPQQNNGHHFEEDICKCILLIDVEVRAYDERYSQNTPHSSTSRVSYGVSIVSIIEELTIMGYVVYS